MNSDQNIDPLRRDNLLSSEDTTGTYQHDLNSKDTDSDPIIDEITDSPADELGTTEAKFKAELDELGDNDMAIPDDDLRETIEDRDEDEDNAVSRPQ